MPPGTGRSSAYPGNGVNYYYGTNAASSSGRSTTALPANPVVPAVVRPVVATTPAAPSSQYFRMSYYYPTRDPGPAASGAEDAGTGRLAPVPLLPRLQVPPGR